MAHRIVLGAPVANRAWSLPSYFAALSAQTVRPDALVFVHSGLPGDDTHRALDDGRRLLGVPLKVLYDPSPPHDRNDRERFGTLAKLRNRLLAYAHCVLDPDVFVSLDSDVMLRDRRTLERLAELIAEGHDTAQPVCFLHPKGEDSECVNFGLLREGAPFDPYRAWTRPPADQIDWGELAELRLGVPMAAFAMSPRVLAGCRYRWHESGEDLGFALDLERIGARCVVDTGLRAFHAWDESHLVLGQAGIPVPEPQEATP